MHLARLTTGLLAAAISVGALSALDRGPLTKQRIYELVAAAVSTAEILRVISTASKIDFNLQPGFTDALIKSGVSEEIVKAMAARENVLAFAPSELSDSANELTKTPSGVPTTSISIVVPSTAECKRRSKNRPQGNGRRAG